MSGAWPEEGWTMAFLPSGRLVSMRGPLSQTADYWGGAHPGMVACVSEQFVLNRE